MINAGNSRKTVALEVRILLAVVAVMIVKQVASVLSTLWGYIFVTLALGYIGAIPFSAFYTSYIEDNWSAAFSAWTHLLVWIAAFNAVATLHRLDHAHSNGVGDKPPMNPMIRWVVATIESKGKNATPLYVGFVAIWLEWLNNVIGFPASLSFISVTLMYLFDPATYQVRVTSV